MSIANEQATHQYSKRRRFLKKSNVASIGNEYSCVVCSPIGKLGIITIDDKVAKVDFLPSNISLIPPQNAMVRKIVSEIKQFFCDPKFKFNLMVSLQGTALQKKIWEEIKKIPVGSNKTYGELASKLGTSPRVVGNACGCNSVPVIIPCHRVVAATGLGGYGGGKDNEKLMKIKKWLLQHECN